MDSYALGIDIGTTYTAAAIARRTTDGGLTAESLELGMRKAAVPTVVFLGEDGTVLVGEPAERRALDRPERVVREFKRRVGDEMPIIVGDLVPAAEDLFALVARWVVDRAETQEGGPPSTVAISHPASWGGHRLDLVRAALAGVGLAGVALVSEPEAAGLQYLAHHELEPSRALAVYDLGGGTFDVALLRPGSTGELAVIGTPRGLDRLGGSDFDQLVFDHVRSQADAAFNGSLDAEPELTVALARIRRDCTDAKESLSFDTDTTIPVLLPGGHSRVRLVRSEFEQMIGSELHRTVDLLRSSIDDASVDREDVAAVLLIGGSSRIPAVTQLISAELDLPVVIDADPKATISLGAATAAARALAAPERVDSAAAVGPSGASPSESDLATTGAADGTATEPSSPARGRVSLGVRAILLAGVSAAVIAAVLPITPLGADGGPEGSGANETANGPAGVGNGRYAIGTPVAPGTTELPAPADDPFTQADESEAEASPGPLKAGRSAASGPTTGGASSAPVGDAATTPEAGSQSPATSPPGSGSPSTPSTQPAPSSEPVPSPDPVPEPTPDPVPDPTPSPDPVPESDPVPEPDPLPEPEPVPEPEPEPTTAPEPTAEPTADPTPEPTDPAAP